MKKMLTVMAVMGLVLALGAPAWATGGGLIDSHDVTSSSAAAAAASATGGAGGSVINAPTTNQSPVIVNAPSVKGGDVKNDNRDTTIVGVGVKNKVENKVSNRNDNRDSNVVSVDASTGDTPYQAPAVFAPNLTAVPETCMGSISTGGSAAFSGAGFGLTFGTTWKSHDCELRMFARSLAQLGPQYATAAVALLAQNADVKKALLDAGITVPGAKAEVPVASVPAAVKQEKRDVSGMKDNRPAVQAVSALQAQREQIQGM